MDRGSAFFEMIPSDRCVTDALESPLVYQHRTFLEYTHAISPFGVLSIVGRESVGGNRAEWVYRVTDVLLAKDLAWHHPLVDLQSADRQNQVADFQEAP